MSYQQILLLVMDLEKPLKTCREGLEEAVGGEGGGEGGEGEQGEGEGEGEGPEGEGEGEGRRSRRKEKAIAEQRESTAVVVRIISPFLQEVETALQEGRCLLIHITLYVRGAIHCVYV